MFMSRGVGEKGHKAVKQAEPAAAAAPAAPALATPPAPMESRPSRDFKPPLRESQAPAGRQGPEKQKEEAARAQGLGKTEIEVWFFVLRCSSS
eukprot:g27291.t1